MLDLFFTFLVAPFALFIGLSILGFILGLIADPYYGMPDDKPRKEMIKRRKKR
jgi:hypothetical protein